MANDLTALQAQVFSSKLLTNVRSVNVMLANRLVNTDWDGDLQGHGGAITLRGIGNVTIREYTRDTTVQYQDLTAEKETFFVDQGKYFAFFVDDLDKYTSDVDALEAYAEQAQADMSDDIEARILSVYNQADAANRITGASNAPIAIDPSNVYPTLLKASKALDDQSVPSVGRWAVVDTSTKNAIAASPDLVRSTAMGDAMVQGVAMNSVNRIGNIAGFDLYWSNKAPSDANAKYIVFGDPKAITYAGVVREVEKRRIDAKIATAMRGLLVDGAFVPKQGKKRLGYIKVAK